MQQVGFFVMLKSVWAVVASLASASQRVANAADNLGQWAEETTGAFVDEARIERKMKGEEMQRKRAALNTAAAQPTIAAPVVTDVEVKP